MPRNATIYKLLVSCPSDLNSTRNIVKEIVLEWNTNTGSNEGIWFEPIDWATHSVPQYGKRPQAILNEQLIKDSDIIVALFWAQLGTPTGKAPSGTVEEIIVGQKLNKPVLLYFSNRSIPKNEIKPKEIIRLNKFKEICKKKGLYREFRSHSELKNILHRHLTSSINKLRYMDIPNPLNNYCKQYPNLSTATDIRAQRVRTTAESFMAASEAIFSSLKKGDEVITTDAVNLSQFPLYWAIEGLEYLRINHEATKRGVKIKRIFVAQEHDLKDHKEIIQELCRLQYLSGVTPIVVKYEDLDKDLRREFAVFGHSFVDEVIYDYFSQEVVDNYIWWTPQVIENFKRKANLIESKNRLDYKINVRKAINFKKVREYAEGLRMKFEKL
ncbi:hypothetical protein HZA73_00895 [candidate division TA06 bacterium]|nr:hypothetical protein [candidate division TA06 bacterium]